MFCRNSVAGTALAIFAGVALVSCSDPTTLPTRESARATDGGPGLLSSRAPGAHRTMRDDFRDIAQRAPGFAGLFVDEGELVINTTSPALSPIVRSEVSRWLAGIGRTDLATRTAVARRVAHDYTRLVAAFETAAATAARIPGVNSFWIDDRENEVGIGVNNSGVASVVSQAVSTSLANASPEVASVSIAVRVMPIRDLGLQTTFVSLGGGIQIQEWNGDECTIGFVGWRNTSPGSGSPDLTYRIVTTASHCTSSQTTMNSDLFGQPNPLRIVADEVAEATVYPSTNPYCAAKSYPQCRFADVAILKVRDSIASIAGSVKRPGIVGGSNS